MPKTIIKATVPYTKTKDFNKEQAIADFLSVIEDNPSYLCLYWSDPVPIHDGGKFYSSDEWEPDDDYDSKTRDWWIAAINAKDCGITEPYTDLTTGDLVTSISYAIRENSKVTGVLAMDITLDELSNIVKDMKITSNGQSFLVDSNSLYLTNDVFENILEKSIFDDYPMLSKLSRRYLAILT